MPLRNCFNHHFLCSLLLLIMTFPVLGQIEIDPYGFGVSMEEGENSQVQVIISNISEDNLNYEIDARLVEEEDERRGGPRRDDLGDVIRSIEVHAGRWIGLAWDGELLWGSDQRDNWRMTPVNMDGEVLDQVNVEINNYYGSCWDGENFWLAHYNDSRLARVDREGRLLNAIQINAQPFGMTCDGETLWYARYQAQDIQQITLEGEVLRTWDCNGIEARRTMDLAWVPDHPDGMLWITACDPGTIYQVNVEEDPPEIVQTVNVEDSDVYGLEHDGENLWYTTDQGDWICIDDGVAEIRMLAFDPNEGEIQGQGVVELDAIILGEGIEAGIYNYLVEISFFDPDNEEDEPILITMSVVVSIDSPTADLVGIVSSSRDDQVIPDAKVELYDSYEIIRITDEEGRYEIDALPAGAYTFTISAEDFLTETVEFNIDGEGEIELNFELAQAEFVLEPEEIAAELEPGEEFQTMIGASNTGNGPLTFMSERRLIGDANADPWNLRIDVPAGMITDDARVHGAVFIEDNFYASGANAGEPAIYVINREQELVSQYPQLGEARYGYKDLATDGEVIWGSGERNIYGFTPDGEEVTSFDCGISPCNNLAWDSDREILWASGTTTDIAGFDQDGNQVAEIDRLEYRIYGLAYWPDDPDGYQLYIYHKINEVGNLMIAKIDLENNQAIDVEILEPEGGGSAQGCFITNQYDIYSWVFMGMANSGAEDRIDIWQLDARKDWMAIQPVEGVIAGGEEQELTVTLDATGLPQALFEGEILFTHDGVGGETTLPISLQVGAGGGPEIFVIELANGWNMVSAYVQPDPEDVIGIMEDLVEAETLIMVKNGSGQFYNPQFGFNNIPGWQADEGYMIKMDGADELTLTGESLPWDTIIPLEAGWQMISFYPREGIDAIAALSGIVDALLMAKDGSGRFYSPAFGFSNMGDMVPGQGYLLKMDEDAELVYTVEEELASQSSHYLQTSLLPDHPNTGENMSMLILTDISEGEIGIFSGGNLIGSGVIRNGKCGIAVWGDDSTTPDIDGALNGTPLEILLQDGNGLHPVKSDVLSGDNRYLANGFQVVRITDITASPEQFGIVDVYPNPFNSSTSLTYNLPEAARIEVSLYDLAGRQVADIVSRNAKAGQHTITVDGAGLSSGVYVVKLCSYSGISKRKLTLVK
jgi:hypothetical protein